MSDSYIGMNAETGRMISGVDHIRQSLGKLFSTALRSRVMRRDIGTIIPDLVDQPLNGKTRMQLMAASVMVIRRWEPRVTPTSVTLQLGEDGAALCAEIGTAVIDGPSSGKTDTLSVQLKG